MSTTVYKPVHETTETANYGKSLGPSEVACWWTYPWTKWKN